MEEVFFAVEAAGVALHGAGFSEDSVAGDEDADGVLAGGCAGGTDGLGSAGAGGELGVGDGLAEGDGGDLLPYFLLEGSAGGAEGDGESGARAGEEFIKLGGSGLEDGVIGGELPIGLDGGGVGAVGEVEAGEVGGGGGEEEVAEVRGV